MARGKNPVYRTSGEFLNRNKYFSEIVLYASFQILFYFIKSEFQVADLILVIWIRLAWNAQRSTYLFLPAGLKGVNKGWDKGIDATLLCSNSIQKWNLTKNQLYCITIQVI